MACSFWSPAGKRTTQRSSCSSVVYTNCINYHHLGCWSYQSPTKSSFCCRITFIYTTFICVTAWTRHALQSNWPPRSFPLI
jgi:hypothetical protein